MPTPLFAVAATIFLIAAAALYFLLRPGAPPYRRAELFTAREAAFYKELRRISQRRGLVLFAKIRMADLLRVERGARSYQSWFNRISQKHADFVLCDKMGTTVLLIVELDDRTHDRPERRQRDQFVDAAYRAAGIPILHIRDERGRELEQAVERALYPSGNGCGRRSLRG